MNYWTTLVPPYCPNEEDIEEFRKHVFGTVLLLGSTKQLLGLATTALDIEPAYADTKIQQGDWLENTHYYDTIIGDGVICLTKQLCEGIIEMAQAHCKRLFVRAFDHKLPNHRIAVYFPQIDDFPIRPTTYIPKGEYNFYGWDFDR